MTASVPDLLRAADAAIARGDWIDAIAGYHAALAQEPQHAAAWYNLGYAQRAEHAFDAALASYQAALAHGIDQPEAVHVNRAAILSENLGRDSEAEAELDLALRRNPRFVVALLNLGQIHEDRGDPEAARGAYAQALAIEPHNGRALLRATMTDLFTGRQTAMIPVLEAALADPRLAADDRCDIGFALGNAYDADGRYADAWRVITEANRIDQSLLPAGARYDRAAHDVLIETLCAMPPPTPVADDVANDVGNNSADAGAAPIFILGLFRSGSTLIEQILGRHSAVTAGGEFDALPRLVADAVQPYPARLADASVDDLAEWRAAYLAAVQASQPVTGLFTDKRCDNFLHIGLIKALFPNAKIICTVRDPLDIMVSTLFLRFGSAVHYGAAPEVLAHWIAAYGRVMAHMQTLYGPDIISVDYDRLVADPEPEVRAMLSGLGLPWEPACLQVRDATTVRTASAWQVRQPLHTRSSGRWRHYVEQLADSRAALGLTDDD